MSTLSHRLITAAACQHLIRPLKSPQPQRRCLSSSSSLFLDLSGPSSHGRNKDKKKRAGTSAKPSYRFVDKLRMRTRGGEGGKGSLSLLRIGRKRKVRPDGGHGGDGGSVILFADPKTQSLRMSNPHVTAASGSNGSSQEKHGRKGKNTIVRVPCGVVVKRVLAYSETWNPETRQVQKLFGEDTEADYDFSSEFSSDDDDSDDDDDEYLQTTHGLDPEMIGFSDWDALNRDFSDDFDHNHDEDQETDLDDDRERVTLADLDQPGSYVVVARGGKGGTGSSIFASLHGGLPDGKILTKNARPEEGEVALLELELKLIADIGLVGFPNAGKSSLLCAMSRAGPRVAPYPFTTLNPFVGVVEYRDGFRLKAADIPGLIDGASQGKGKGHEFLRHLERTKALLYIVDAAGTDGRDPIEDLKILANELAQYGDGDMLTRRALVVANKLDLLKEEKEAQVMADLATAADEMGIQVFGNVHSISAGVTGQGLSPLSEAMRQIVLQYEQDTEANE
ncbi:GTPase Obg [Seminavis robusta]|uniref:GTPase Obg n=1 Tax=Seminavis robusta TaxID=568900 RepID=A0A9N8HVT7_9STRA|nr:GTPase Obg [Seminavis robusta]|eukprot:Sro2416_g326900.1 GTPase Obg (507) ;mRNA; r:9582-11102